MNKAFIFDMDGVLIDSENAWEPVELPMLVKLFGPSIGSQIGDLIGTSIRYVYERGRTLGSLVSEEEVARAYNETAVEVYANAKITDNLDRLGETLSRLGFHIGLVTQSPTEWIGRVLSRVSFKERFEVVVSLREREDLQMKPAPDGYLEAFRVLDADPKQSIVLEDSNHGIQAGKASGAYVIGFRGNLPENYKQEGADAYADTMDDVIKLVVNLDSPPLH